MMEHCTFKDNEGIVTTVPCHHSNGLDFLDIEVLKMTVNYKNDHPAQICQLTKVSRGNMSIAHKMQEAHIRLGHVSYDTLIKMSKKGIIEGIPHMETPIPMVCRTCFQRNRKRLPRTPIDTTRPHIMTKFSIDFMFYSHLSLRGHNSAFTIVDQGSRYAFTFPCCAKRPPISILTFFIKYLRNMGFHPAVFKMDEGGELCK